MARVKGWFSRKRGGKTQHIPISGRGRRQYSEEESFSHEVPKGATGWGKAGIATFPGKCLSCGEPLHRGDRIYFRRGQGAIHANCEPPTKAEKTWYGNLLSHAKVHPRAADIVWFEALSSKDAKEILSEGKYIDPNENLDAHYTMKEMVQLADWHGGTLEGYLHPDDEQKIVFTGFTLKTSKENAEEIREDSHPSEFQKTSEGYRFWWD